MNRLPRALIIGAALSLAALAYAGDETLCTAPAHACEKQIREILSKRKYLGVKVATTRGGLYIQRVVKDSPAYHYGLRAGDRVLALNGRDMTHAEIRDFKSVLNEFRESPKLVFTINRAGAIHLYPVRPASLSKEQIDRAVEAHLREAHPDETESNRQ